MGPDDRTSRMDPTRERALVDRARVDPSAFGELYDFYLPRIHGFVARRLVDRAAAEDVTAMTFERALGAVRSDGFRNDSFGGWLYRVAANAVIDHVRRDRHTRPTRGRAPASDGGQRRPRSDALAAIGDERAERALDAALDRDVLRRALARLGDDQRRLIVLRYVDGLDTDALGAVLGCSAGTLAVRHHRALRALRAAIVQESTDVA